jgi:hypothetical protein
MSKFAIASVAAVFGLASLTTAKPGHAFAYKIVDGRPLKHHSGFKMARDRCSIPDNSEERTAFRESAWQWGQLQNKMDWNWSYDSGCTMSPTNGRSEAGLVFRSSISGNSGLTTTRRDGDRILEADVKVANDRTFSVPAEYRSSDQGYGVFTHELGHALGLEHDDLPLNWNVMKTLAPYPVTGGGNVQPMRDDYEGIKFLYGAPAGHNLYVTALDVWLYSHKAFDTGTIDSCRGGAFSFSYAVMHNGVGPVNARLRFFLQKRGSGAQTNLLTTNATVDLGFKETRTFTVPSALASGDYYIMWEIDSTGIIDEWNETDNLTRSGAMLRVIDC